MLEREEVARLEADLPRLEDWGASLLVPFQARKLRGAGVVWINERWFLERHLDVTCPATRQRACAWLVNQFACGVPGDSNPAGAYTDEEKTFHADRYGGSGGIVPHGGSGRAGISGCFQAKGIGVTPLVGEVRSWTYSHGCMWLEEALREAIYSEIAAAEFPHGAVPVVAVLDAGMRYVMPDGEPGERRAIVVRPVALRPSHLERAPMFGGARRERQEKDTNDTSDVDRVVDVVRAFDAGVAAGGMSGLRVSGLMDLLTRVAEQVAFGQVHRLCHGGYLTSNLTLNGELLDFGSFRSVPDWSKVFPLDNMPGFGDEMLLLGSAIRSLVFYHRKYKRPEAPAVSEPLLVQVVARVLAARFDLECLRVWRVNDVADADLRRAVIEAMREYFAAQQKITVSYQRGFRSIQPWIGDALAGEQAEDGSLEARLLARVDAALDACFGASGRARRELSHFTATRLLRPRPSLYREDLQSWLYDRLGGQKAASPPDADSLSDAIRECLSSGRRHWPFLTPDLAVVAQVSWGHSSALLCRDVDAASWCLWAEGVRSGDRVRLFDRWVPIDSVVEFHAASDERRWAGRFPVREDASGFDLSVPSRHFTPPDLARWHTIIDPDRIRASALTSSSGRDRAAAG